jgi:hypothetical protein
LTTEALLDRYHSHTQHCHSCRTALHRLQALRWGLLGFSALGWSLIPVALATGSLTGLVASLLAILPLGSAAAGAGLGRLERRFYQGRAIPPRNLPDPKAKQ